MKPLPADPADAETGLGPDLPWFHPFAGARAARGAVRRALERGERCVALCGPDGIGKTRLLADLPTALGRRFRVAQVPLAALPPRELLIWVLGALGLEPGEDPAKQLLDDLGLPSALPLVLAIDEANAMPPATARQLGAWVTQAGGQLRVVLALSPDARAPRVRSSLAPDVVEVAFERTLTPDEGRAFVEAWIDRAAPVASRRARFDPTTIAGLYATAGGLPGRLTDLAQQVLDGGPAVQPTDGFRLSGDFDPFAVSARPDAYVARPATEEALSRLAGELEAGTPALAMIGPPGLGKTQILRVLAHKLTGHFRTLHVAYGSLEPAELERWILSLLGEPAGVTSLLEAARAGDGAARPLLLLVDDAGAVPEASQRWLHAQMVASEGALRLVFAATDSPGVRPLAGLAGLEPAVRRIPLTDPLDEHEAEAYLDARLRAAAAPEPVRRAFNARSVRALHDAAAGNPAELQRLADARVRELGGVPPAPAPRPRAFDPEAVAAPRFLRGRRAAVVLACAGVGAAAFFLLPALTHWSPADAPRRAPSPTRMIGVHINATPWARVFVNGRDIGVTPLGNVELAEGTHRLRAVLADGSVVERQIRVDDEHRHVVLP